MDKPTCGWLEKKADHVKTWRKRWCVVRGKFLFYVKDPKDDLMFPKGVIDLGDCGVGPTPDVSKARPHAFAITHKRRRTFHLCASSEAEMHMWIEAIRRSIRSEKPVFLEYHGRGIDDPDDAKAIATANVEIENFAYKSYKESYDQLLHATEVTARGFRKAAKLKRSKRTLAKEVKALKERLDQLQLEFNQVEERLSELKKHKASGHPSFQRMVAASSALRERLALSSVENLQQSLGPSALALDETELIRKSQDTVEQILPELNTVSRIALESDELDVKSLLVEFLTRNVEMRTKLNSYSEHIVTLTQRKLETFERAFEQKGQDQK